MPVVPVNGAVDLEDQFAERLEAGRVAEVDLELRVEALLVAVLPRARLLAAGDGRTEERQCFNESFGCILSAVVRVEDRGTCMVRERRKECVQDELRRVCREYRPTDDLAREDVHHGGEKHETPLPRQVREVGDPHVPGAERTRVHEQIRVFPRRNRLVPLGFSASPPVRLHAEESHHSADAFLVHTQVESDALVPV